MVAPGTPTESAPSFKMCATGGNAIRAHERRTHTIVGVGVVSLGIPILRCLALEVRIWKQAKAHNAAGFAIHFRVDAGRLRLDAFVQPETILVRLAGGFES